MVLGCIKYNLCPKNSQLFTYHVPKAEYNRKYICCEEDDL